MVTVDVVVFSLHQEKLYVLLIRRGKEPYRDCWALPGGFVEMNECLSDAARRELREETGLYDLYIEQLYSFGQPDRDPRGRNITIAYYALIAPNDNQSPRHGDDAAAVSWFPLRDLPALAFDHEKIISTALERLQGKLHYTTAAFSLLPREFTLSQVQQVYEAVWQKTLDRRNFRKWILTLHVLDETGNVRADGPHRPAKLYQFDRTKVHASRLELLGPQE
jgi:8-oxo-dGTP diphosphatase